MKAFLAFATVLCVAQVSSGVAQVTDVTVETEPVFFAALGTPSVTCIRLGTGIVLGSNSVIPGAASSGIYELTRNLTITVPLGADYPTNW